MCDFCTQHGEGKKWYLQAKNYDREILSDETWRQMMKGYETPEENAVNRISEFDKQVAADFTAVRNMLMSGVEQQKKIAWGQVVPLEDAEQIIDMSTGIVRLSCACRKLRGVHNARFCFGLHVIPKELRPAILESPDYSNDLEVLTKEEAKEAFREMDREGLVHLVLSQTPFIKAICNCDATYCGALRNRSRFNYQGSFYKAEYVATIDWEKCDGCRECMKVCNFGDISYSPAVEKCYINQFLCFGCGVCRSVCPTDAITLHDRNAIPALSNEW
ncbi:MAG: 4Fe-4S binding protein [Dehalococcoidales bacterium]|nr:MAG: 4Fe-4S binding protein [Dehalococcoidales bacterium]